MAAFSRKSSLQQLLEKQDRLDRRKTGAPVAQPVSAAEAAVLREDALLAYPYTVTDPDDPAESEVVRGEQGLASALAGDEKLRSRTVVLAQSALRRLPHASAIIRGSTAALGAIVGEGQAATAGAFYGFPDEGDGDGSDGKAANGASGTAASSPNNAVVDASVPGEFFVLPRDPEAGSGSDGDAAGGAYSRRRNSGDDGGPAEAAYLVVVPVQTLIDAMDGAGVLLDFACDAVRARGVALPGKPGGRTMSHRLRCLASALRTRRTLGHRDGGGGEDDGDDAVLILLRVRATLYELDCPGGRRRLGEAPRAGALRACAAATGVDLSTLEPTFDCGNRAGTHRLLVFGVNDLFAAFVAVQAAGVDTLDELVANPDVAAAAASEAAKKAAAAAAAAAAGGADGGGAGTLGNGAPGASKRRLYLRQGSSELGRVKFYNAKQGFGYIEPRDANADDLKVYANDIVNCAQTWVSKTGISTSLAEGEEVEFEYGLRDGVTVAVRVTGPAGVPVKGREAHQIRVDGSGSGGDDVRDVRDLPAGLPRPASAANATTHDRSLAHPMAKFGSTRSMANKNGNTPCRDWDGTPGSCRFGASCAFLHGGAPGGVARRRASSSRSPPRPAFRAASFGSMGDRASGLAGRSLAKPRSAIFGSSRSFRVGGGGGGERGKSSTPCRDWDGTPGSCSFGDECGFLHAMPAAAAGGAAAGNVCPPAAVPMPGLTRAQSFRGSSAESGKSGGDVFGTRARDARDGSGGGIRRDTLCRDWDGTEGSCRYGDRCGFRHGVMGGRRASLRGSSAPQLAAVSERQFGIRHPSGSMKTSNTKCRAWDGTEGSCKYGAGCGFRHVL